MPFKELFFCVIVSRAGVRDNKALYMACVMQVGKNEKFTAHLCLGEAQAALLRPAYAHLLSQIRAAVCQQQLQSQCLQCASSVTHS